MVIEKAVCQGCFFCTAYIGGWDVIDLIIIIMAGIREKIAYYYIPEPFQGFSTVILTAGLMAIEIFGISDLI